jgi:hypothetical protein
MASGVIEGKIPGFIFWPKKKIVHAFQEADRAKGTPGELTALRVFHRRMQFFLKTADGIGFTDPESGVLEKAKYERPRLIAEIARIEGKTPAPSCAGYPFIAGCKNQEAIKC